MRSEFQIQMLNLDIVRTIVHRRHPSSEEAVNQLVLFYPDGINLPNAEKPSKSLILKALFF